MGGIQSAKETVRVVVSEGDYDPMLDRNRGATD